MYLGVKGRHKDKLSYKEVLIMLVKSKLNAPKINKVKKVLAKD